MKDGKLRLVVLGMMGRCPFGGQTWLYLNWLRGLAQLGFDVWYVEDDSVWPYDPERDTVTDDCPYAGRHIARSMERSRLPGRWAFHLADRPDASQGLERSDLDELYRSCDALLNVVGATDLRDEQLAAPFRVHGETDPVTAELRLAAGDEHTRTAFADHRLIATCGENYGAPETVSNGSRPGGPRWSSRTASPPFDGPPRSCSSRMGASSSAAAIGSCSRTKEPTPACTRCICASWAWRRSPRYPRHRTARARFARGGSGRSGIQAVMR